MIEEIEDVKDVENKEKVDSSEKKVLGLIYDADTGEVSIETQGAFSGVEIFGILAIAYEDVKNKMFRVPIANSIVHNLASKPEKEDDNILSKIKALVDEEQG